MEGEEETCSEKKEKQPVRRLKIEIRMRPQAVDDKFRSLTARGRDARQGKSPLTAPTRPGTRMRNDWISSVCCSKIFVLCIGRREA